MLSEPIITIGRHPDCDLQICEASVPYVSRLQCVVVRTQSRCVVYDMCSLMGTMASSHGGDEMKREAEGESAASLPDARRLLVFPWKPGAELTLKVTYEGASMAVKLRESLL